MRDQVNKTDISTAYLSPKILPDPPRSVKNCIQVPPSMQSATQANRITKNNAARVKARSAIAKLFSIKYPFS